ncbi:unnamed protein product [Cylicocyclus nassatus]|uniref:Metalloendopeptidase n=1 Tax=Cylicocyclus nassatus TaxID=53992 RepID=A0AA36H7B2_CYLNA|nr:unnamed protein product [Cylicocyclus nassatus]
MLLPFFVFFPLVKAVTTSANDKRSSVNATVSFHRPSAVVVNADNSQTANVVYGGHNLRTDESEKRSADAVNRKHFKGLAIFSDDPGIWPGAEVPYELVPYLNDTQRRYVRYAINAFKINTCIKFRKRTERDIYYLLITAIPKKWCYSIVGRDTSSRCRTNEGKFITELNMDPECFDGPAMIHELMHSIGFYHEHQREDRDPLVTAGPPDPNPEREYQDRRLTYSRTEAQYMGSIAVRKNTAPRGNNMNIRNTSGENIMRKYNPCTNAKRNPGNAAKRGPEYSREKSSRDE